MADTGWIEYDNIQLDVSTSTSDFDWDGANPLTNLLVYNDVLVCWTQVDSPCSGSGTFYTSRLQPYGISNASVGDIYGHLSGMEVKTYLAKGTTPDIFDHEVKVFVKGTGLAGSDKAKSTVLITDLTYPYPVHETYGGATDLWGSALQLTDLISNTANIGSSLYYRHVKSAVCSTAYCDALLVKFHYDTGAMFAAM